jgi:hypothetical protein
VGNETGGSIGRPRDGEPGRVHVGQQAANHLGEAVFCDFEAGSRELSGSDGYVFDRCRNLFDGQVSADLSHDTTVLFDIPRCRHGQILLACDDDSCPEQNAYVAEQRAAMDAYEEQLRANTYAALGFRVAARGEL